MTGVLNLNAILVHTQDLPDNLDNEQQPSTSSATAADSVQLQQRTDYGALRALIDNVAAEGDEDNFDSENAAIGHESDDLDSERIEPNYQSPSKKLSYNFSLELFTYFILKLLILIINKYYKVLSLKYLKINYLYFRE